MERIEQLIAVHDQLASRRRQADLAASCIVMTLSAVDTYFGQRLGEDFERRFNVLTSDELAQFLGSFHNRRGTGNGGERYDVIARALQNIDPRGVIIEHYRRLLESHTFQGPKAVQDELNLFGVDNVWKSLDDYWLKKWGRRRSCWAEFEEWAKRRHEIAHRTGRGQKNLAAKVSKARYRKNAAREEAKACLEFFQRLVGLMDYKLNERQYGRQPRRRAGSRLAVFTLDVERRRTSRPVAHIAGARPLSQASEPMLRLVKTAATAADAPTGMDFVL